MEHYAAIDVSLEWSSVCVVDAAGQIVREAKVLSECQALVAFFAESGLRFSRIGLEAGPLSQWLYAGLVEAGLPAILIETRHVKAALKAMTVKTDRNYARGMAQLMRMGWFRPVHVKAPMVQEIRGPFNRAQAAGRQAAGRREQPPRHSARLRAEGRRDWQGPVRGSHPRARGRPGEARSGSPSRCFGHGPRLVPNTLFCTASCSRWCARMRCAAG